MYSTIPNICHMSQREKSEYAMKRRKKKDLTQNDARTIYQ